MLRKRLSFWKRQSAAAGFLQSLVYVKMRDVGPHFSSCNVLVAHKRGCTSHFPRIDLNSVFKSVSHTCTAQQNKITPCTHQPRSRFLTLWRSLNKQLTINFSIFVKTQSSQLLTSERCLQRNKLLLLLGQEKYMFSLMVKKKAHRHLWAEPHGKCSEMTNNFTNHS